MRIKTPFLLCLVSLLLFASISMGSSQTLSLTTGVQVDGFESDADESGLQIITPIELSACHKGMEIMLLTGYVYSTADLEGDKERSIDAMVDTKLNLTYTFLDRFPFDLLFGIDFNIPTGLTGISDTDLKVISDPDLLSITTYGEGWNIGPHISLTKEWENFTVGAGLSYTVKGEYEYSDNLKNYDPGDTLLFAAQVDYDISTRWTAGLSGEYAYFGEDTVRGNNFIQEGNYFLIGSTLQYIRTNWDLSLSVTAIYRDKRKMEREEGNFTKENRNSNGDEYITDVSYRYFIKKGTTFNTELSYLLLNENDYNRNDSFYMGERQKTTLSVELSQDILSSWNLTGRLSGFLMEDGSTWLHPDEDRSYKGYSGVLLVTSRF